MKKAVFKGYKDLKVWQKAMQLAKQVYLFTASFPANEQYGLTSQLKRAVVSVPSNIAEGASRKSTKDYIRFLNIAYGSLAEIETQIILSQELGFTKQESVDALLPAIDEIQKMLSGLRSSLEEKLSEAPQYPILNTQY